MARFTRTATQRFAVPDVAPRPQPALRLDGIGLTLSVAAFGAWRHMPLVFPRRSC
jgi:hypothetical protein